MIPHKSRYFRTILDLSFQIRHRGKLMESVNSATVKMAPAESMIQLRHCVQCLIALLADNYHPKNPFMLSKLDVTDGFWRMVVSNDDTWNFSYVLPQADPDATLKQTLIAVPNYLQIGWCKSRPFFGASSETARDVIEVLLLKVSLLENLFEENMLNTSANLWIQATIHFSNIAKAFVDNFIGETNNISKENLEHFSRAIILGVHSISPPQEVYGRHGEDNMSQKKLNQGEGTWEYT